MNFIKRFIGDKAFYKKALAVAIPIMIQNGVTNLVNVLDNVMVGRISTEAMSGVSIVNQFVFVFNLLIFGTISGAGIFTAQFHGQNDAKGEMLTFRFKAILCTVLGAIGIGTFLLFDEELIMLFLHDGSAEGDLAATLAYGKEYLYIIVIGLVPYALSQAFASTMRETKETVVPMVSSVVAVGLNCLLNYILIFGKLGAPALGCAGAAIATVVSRFAELLILVLYAYLHKEKCRFIVGAFRALTIPKELFLSIAAKGMPLMINEFFWSLGMTLRNQCYSTRGLDVVAAQNISSTFSNLFNVVFMALGQAVGVLVGNLLGAGETEKAKDTARKMIAFSVFTALITGSLLAAASPLFPLIYNTTADVRSLATFFLLVSAGIMPLAAFANSSYYTLRSGGKVVITIAFDSGFMWAFVLPLSFILSRFTGMSIYLLFFICQFTDIGKDTLGFILLKKIKWANKLV